MPAGTPPSEEIQMDINGDGIVDESESQNQTGLAGSTPPSEEIQMDINGDGIVDEFESQNQTGLAGSTPTFRRNSDGYKW